MKYVYAYYGVLFLTTFIFLFVCFGDFSFLTNLKSNTNIENIQTDKINEDLESWGKIGLVVYVYITINFIVIVNWVFFKKISSKNYIKKNNNLILLLNVLGISLIIYLVIKILCITFVFFTYFALIFLTMAILMPVVCRYNYSYDKLN